MTHTRLLVLDDDEAVGQTISLMAESLGVETRSVGSSDAFFAELDAWQPDFVCIDLVLPEIDGVQILGMLADRGSQVSVIIVSGLESRVLEAAQRSADSHGLSIAGLLPKPFTKQRLAGLLTEAKRRGKRIESRLARPDGSSGGLMASEEELRKALDNHELVVAYQPKVGCRTLGLEGFEALVRWNHPTRGLLTPAYFLEVADECGLMDELSEQVFEMGVRWLSQNFSASNVGLSLNMSATSLEDYHLIDTLTNICGRFDVASSRVVLELTESNALRYRLQALDLMTRLRMRGFNLSIDDFGAGFSSMVQLVELPFSEIKIDKSFVLSASRSPETRTVVKAIVDLGHSLGLHVVAEGVEDQETLDLLRVAGCDSVQGYYLARPMLGEAAVAWALAGK